VSSPSSLLLPRWPSERGTLWGLKEGPRRRTFLSLAMSLKAPLLLCLFLAAATCSMDSATESQFKDFIARHGKFFSPAELPIRRAAFAESLSELDRMHKLNPNARFALNEHADLSSTEWRRRCEHLSLAARRATGFTVTRAA
jgi:hypothetical protein